MSHITTTVGMAAVGTDVLGWVTALATVAAVLVALLLGLGLADWLRRPKLRLESSPDNPSDRVTTATTRGGPAAYLRARVVNHGRTAAKNVSVAVLAAETPVGTSVLWRRPKPELDGRALAWSNLEHTAAVNIAPGVERYVDVISIVRDLGRWPQGEIPTRVEIKDPPPANQAEWLAPGTWRLRLEVSAENVSAVEWDVAVHFPGVWPQDPPYRVWEVIGVEGPAAPASIGRPSVPKTPVAQGLTDRGILPAAEDDDQDESGTGGGARTRRRH
jgi:hypothetical protein